MLSRTRTLALLTAKTAMHPTLHTPASARLAWAALRSTAALLCGALLLACSTAPEIATNQSGNLYQHQSGSLYQRLGGAGGVARLVHQTLARASTEPSTARSFDGIKLPALEQSLAEQICMLAGGGCRYQGANMADAHKDAHKDARIRDSEFDAMVGILRVELDRAGVSTSAKNELLRLLAPMKREIIAKPGARATAVAASH